MPRIGVQTHLLGMPTKIWPADRWREVLRGVLELRPGAEILLFEPAAEAAGLLIDSRIIPVGGFDIAQAIWLVQEGLDCLISVDSWSKYPAAAAGIPQVIIVPDQRADYPQLTPASLWRHEFAPLHHRPEVHLLGLDAVSGYQFGRMDALTPGMVLEAFRRMNGDPVGAGNGP